MIIFIKDMTQKLENYILQNLAKIFKLNCRFSLQMFFNVSMKKKLLSR